VSWMKDSFGREMTYLRLSVTDGCDLQCRYCALEGSRKEENRLTLPQVETILKAAKRLGISSLRFTGGEPLLHPDIIAMVALARETGIEHIFMTTNGTLLSKKAEELAEAGLENINISLDTLDADAYEQITGKALLLQVLSGIDAAIEAGLLVKLNCVYGEATDWKALCTYALDRKLPLRFIERMPFGQKQRGVRLEKLRQALTKEYGKAMEQPSLGSGPARYIRFENGLCVGMIAAMTQPFCDTCNRIRMNASGNLQTCLCYEKGVDCKDVLMQEQALYERMVQAISEKPMQHHFLQIEAEDRRRGMNRYGG